MWFLILKGTKFGFGFFSIIGLREVVQSFQQNVFLFFWLNALNGF